jgi:hypothetical protein
VRVTGRTSFQASAGITNAFLHVATIANHTSTSISTYQASSSWSTSSATNVTLVSCNIDDVISIAAGVRIGFFMNIIFSSGAGYGYSLNYSNFIFELLSYTP